jgi:replicative DNA helicase
MQRALGRGMRRGEFRLDLQQTILSGLIPRTVNEKSDADAALQEVIQLKLTQAHFTGLYKFLFEVVTKQFARKSILDREIFESYLMASSYTDEEKSQLRIIFTSCREETVDIDKLRALVPTFIEQQNVQVLGNVLTDAAKIITDGLSVGKKTLKGLEDARKYLITNVSGLSSLDSGNSPQGAIQKSMDGFWSGYYESKTNPNFGILSGLTEFDRATKGVRRGELWTIAAYTKHGKSMCLRTFAYHAAVRQKKNVVFASLEMTFEQNQRLFVSLHSTHSRFSNPMGISDESISAGRLSSEQEAALTQVTDDFAQNQDYGLLYLLQLPSGATVATLKSKLIYLNTLFPIDVVFLDYASCLKPDISKNTTTQEVTGIFKDLKDLALTFNEGVGIPVVTAHQISRAKREAVEKSEYKRYDLAYLSDAAEVERSSDLVAWILRTDDLVVSREVKFGLSQFRRGKLPMDFFLREYYDCSQLSDLAVTTHGPGVFQIGEL